MTALLVKKVAFYGVVFVYYNHNSEVFKNAKNINRISHALLLEIEVVLLSSPIGY